jgi:hypothetical protein
MYAEFLSLSTSFATFYLGMYLFVKPATDITTNGEIMISLSIVAINIVFFFYAALLLYRSFKEYAVEKLYTTGETDDETRRIQAHLAALTDEQRDKIERVDQQRREAAEQQQLERRRGSAVGGSGDGGNPNEGDIEMVNHRRARVAMFGGSLGTSSHVPPSVMAHRGTTARIGHRVSTESGWQSAAEVYSSDSVGIELASMNRVPAAVALESVVCIDDGASTSTTNRAHLEALQRLSLIAVDRDGCVSVEAALSHARPLDLVAFVNRRALSNGGGDGSASSALLLQWTHIGVVVDQVLLAGGIANGRVGELYVLEAVLTFPARGGDNDDEPCNVETGTRTDGVQIRSLREVCNAMCTLGSITGSILSHVKFRRSSLRPYPIVTTDVPAQASPLVCAGAADRQSVDSIGCTTNSSHRPLCRSLRPAQARARSRLGSSAAIDHCARSAARLGSARLASGRTALVRG